MNCVYIFFWLLNFVTSAKYYLDSSNKFEDILLFINDNVQEGDGSLLKRIQEHIESASKFLWEATRHLDPNKAGVRFGTVYIKVPENWNIAADPITWQQCNTALFFVTIDNTDKSDQPITKHLQKCGQPGEFTRFPESFFRESVRNKINKKGKQFMTEFATLRYGVFTEKPYKNRLKVFNGVNYTDSVCGKGIKWNITMDNTQCVEPNKICKYTIVPNQSHNYSIMFDTETETSEYFCDDKYRPHNKFAFNLHNRKCKSKSVTSVILNHKDFEQNKSHIPYENVNFRIIKGQSKRIVLVLDTSGSMGSIIANMKIATVEFLKIVESSTQIGIVRFDSFAYKESGLIEIGVDNNRELLINIIKKLHADGGTNIPDGLAQAVEVLGGHISNDAKIFGSIILLTDGQNTEKEPYEYGFVINQIIKKGIVVNAIAYGTDADTSLNQLTSGTGGKYLFANTNTQYTDLAAKFSAKLACDITVDREIKMLDLKTEISIYQKVQTLKAFKGDKYMGTNMTFAVTIPLNRKNLILTLIDPGNRRFLSVNKIEQENSVTFTYQILGKAKAGQYFIEFQSPTVLRHKRETESFTVSITISAKPERESQRIINPTGELSNSKIEMLNDTSSIEAIVDLSTCGILESENVTVLLTMDGPNRKGLIFQMTDDGIGDDANENDKIFTKVLTAKELQEVGFYNFMANVEIIHIETKESITRTVELGSLRIKDKQREPIKDKIPPSKIESLKLRNEPNTKILEIIFNAPGNDGMIGNISKYEASIKSTVNISKVFTRNSAARENISWIFNLDNENITNPFDVSLRGIDDDNNIGEWSDPVIYNWNYKAIYKEFIIEKKSKNSSIKILMSLDVVLLLFSLIFIW